MTTGFMYLQLGHANYSAGEYDASGTWIPESTWPTPKAAQTRADELNAERKAAV